MSLLDEIPSGGADHTQTHRDLANALLAGVQPATVTLSSAQLLALDTVPITIVAAPGAGKWVNIHRVGWYYKYGTAPYAGNPFVYVMYAGHPAGVPNTYQTIDGGADAIDAMPFPSISTIDPTLLVNKAVVAFDVDGPMTGGDGTERIDVWYSIETVP